MDKQQLIDTITKMVQERLNQPIAVQTACENCTCPASARSGIDGVGNLSALLSEGVDRLGLSGLPPLGSCPDRALARIIDHTLLKANATETDIIKHCESAIRYCFQSVCVNPSWVKTAKRTLRGSGVKVCTVVGFPLGATFSRVKALETRIAIDDGADEIDMVIDIGAVKSGLWERVYKDMLEVRRATRTTTILKAILETCYLTDEEIIRCCELAKNARLDFVKTSTGFGQGGARVDHVRLMRKTVGDRMGVKASGGIRDHETALKMIAAGASRLGVSASIQIVECKESSGRGY